VGLLRGRADQGGTKYRMREIEVASGQDDALIIAVTVCIDQMTHD
jgi:uncharacterized protein YxjI